MGQSVDMTDAQHEVLGRHLQIFRPERLGLEGWLGEDDHQPAPATSNSQRERQSFVTGIEAAKQEIGELKATVSSFEEQLGQAKRDLQVQTELIEEQEQAFEAMTNRAIAAEANARKLREELGEAKEEARRLQEKSKETAELDTRQIGILTNVSGPAYPHSNARPSAFASPVSAPAGTSGGHSPLLPWSGQQG